MARKIMEEFKITEISAVDRPAQAHAKMTIMKRHDVLSKSIVEVMTKAEDCEAMTFTEILERNEEQQLKWKAQEALWPIMDAYRESTGKIIADRDLSAADQLSMLETSTAEFLSTIRAKFPEVEAELNKLFNADNVGNHFGKKETQMSEELKKQLADLEKKVGDLTTADATKSAQLAEMTLKASFSDVEKSYYDSLKDDETKKAFGALPAADRVKKAKAYQIEKDAGDEVIKTSDGLEVRKSVVGDSMFAIVKSQEARISSQAEDLKKAQEATAMVGFTKKAQDELANLPGELSKKADLLKAVSGLPEAVRITLDTMLKAGDGAMKAAFDTVGKRSGEVLAGSAQDEVNKKAAEFRKADSNLTEQQAVTKVYNENPKLYDRLMSEQSGN